MFNHLILLRHGATNASQSGLFTGRSDVPLNQEGRNQARAWQPVLGSMDATTYTSPLQRAHETALLAGLTPTPTDLLLEWDMGELEGQNSERYRAAHPGWSLFNDGPPTNTGETPHDIQQRTQKLATHLTTQTGTIILVSHGQYLRTLTTHLLGLPLATAKKLAYGPARAAILTTRTNNTIALTGWNLPPTIGPNLLNQLT